MVGIHRIPFQLLGSRAGDCLFQGHVDIYRARVKVSQGAGFTGVIGFKINQL
jgi:hypothetical protein